MILTYKYRIKDRSARKLLARHAYACNQVWNWCVAQQRDIQDRYRAGGPRRKWATDFDLITSCKSVGADLGIHQHTVQGVCRQFTRSRDRHGCPKFRASFGEKRARGWIPFGRQSRQISGNAIVYLGKRYRFWEGRRPLPETAKGGALVEDALGRWYVSFFVEIEIGPRPQSGAVGIDLGVKSLATLSTGEIIENPRHFNKSARRLATAQRARNKKRRTAAIHAKTANARRDFHHKLSKRLAREYAFIAVGDVNTKNLAIKQIGKSAFDAGWSSFRNMLRYKAANFVEVDEKFTTQTCSSCGALPPGRPEGTAGLGIRKWDCSLCGASHDRDVNAARNILILARSAAGPVEESRETRRVA